MVLFETAHGSKMAGNPYAIFKEMINSNDYKGYTFVWVSNDPNNYYAKQYGTFSNVKFIRRDSFSYVRFLTKAKYLINNTTFPFYFQKKENQVYINTWHGTPLKTLGNDVKGTMGQHKNAIRNFLHADYIINPNRFTYNKIIDSHSIRDHFNGTIVDAGYPRVDLTLNADKEEIRKELAQILDIELNKKIILYAPTWRGEIGKNADIGDELSEHIKQLHNKVPDDYILLLKVHDLTYKLIKNNAYLREVCIPDWIETNQLLSIVDILITDYSSIFFDFLVTDRPIIFFTYDKDAYSKERGLYLDLETLPGPLCTTVDEVVKSIVDIDDINKTYMNKYTQMKNEFCYNDDGQATNRVLDIIFKNVESKSAFNLEKTAKKNILIYGGGFTTNGVTTSLLSLLNNIDYSKYNISIVHGGTITDTIQSNLEKLNPNINILYRMGTFNFTLLEYFRHSLVMNSGLKKKMIKNNIPKKLYKKEMKRILGDAEFDIAIDFSGYSPFWCLLFSFNDFRKKVIYLHSDMHADSERNKIFHKNFRVIFPLYHHFDKLVSVSKDITLINQSKLNNYVNPTKIVNVDNTLDYKRILNLAKESTVEEFLNDKYLLVQDIIEKGIMIKKGIKMPNPNHINFVTIGRLSPEKDHQKLIKAFWKINQMYKNTKLYIIGNGPMRSNLIKLIEHLNLEEHIILVGEMQNPFKLLSECDCFIMSSNYEGQGLVILEALVFKIPVISTDIPGPRGLLQDQYGLLVDNSIEGLQEGMKNFILNKPVYQEFDAISYNEKAIEMFYKEVCEIN